MDNLQVKFREVNDRIKESAKVAGNNFDDITLVTVTKSVGPQSIEQIIAAGAQDIGENRVQEFTKKYQQVEQNVRWHLIGHLQSNKVKYLTGKISLIHSLDRVSLVKELQRVGKINNEIFDVLVQVNVSGEESKFGLAPGKVEDMLIKASKADHIRIKGLMTMAPYYTDPEKARPVFEGLRLLKEKLEKIDLPKVDFTYLSMGMSNDFEVAIEEGANMVRIGSAIFETQ
jgi:pyridoxal phosphate enzyme (YggS family)